MPLRDYNALVKAMERDLKRQERQSGGSSTSPARRPRIT